MNMITRNGTQSVQLVIGSVPKRCDGGRIFGIGVVDHLPGGSICLAEVWWLGLQDGE